MIQAPQIESVSNLSRDYRSVFAKLTAGPVFLAHRSKALAALVSIEEWNRIVALIEEQQDIIDVLEAELELIQAGEQLEEFDSDEFPALADIQASPLPDRQATVAAFA